MPPQVWIVGIQMALGGGIFILLLRLTFMLGSYSQRVVHLEATMVEVKTIVEQLRHELTESRLERQIRARAG